MAGEVDTKCLVSGVSTESGSHTLWWSGNQTMSYWDNLLSEAVAIFLQTTLEAQFLANQLQLYYASKDQERYSLVRQFTHSPQNFDYSIIIAQLQNSGIQLQKEK